MSKKSPVIAVREQFGSKAALAAKVLPLLERPEGQDEDVFARRITTASNAQLLRLWGAYERLQKEFGTKAVLAEKATVAKLGWSNAEYTAKISQYAVTRLLDLYDQASRGK